MATPTDDLDLSSLLPLHDESRSAGDHLVSLFEEHHEDYMDQHPDHGTPDNMDKAMINISDDDILNILGHDDIVTDSTVDSILPIEEETVTIGTTIPSVSNSYISSDPIISDSHPGIIKADNLDSEVTFQIRCPPISSVAQSFPLKQQPVVTTQKPIQPPNVQENSSTTTKVTLPSGRYSIKQSATDPSMMHLSLPNIPPLSPMMIPITAKPATPAIPVVRVKNTPIHISNAQGNPVTTNYFQSNVPVVFPSPQIKNPASEAARPVPRRTKKTIRALIESRNSTPVNNTKSVSLLKSNLKPASSVVTNTTTCSPGVVNFASNLKSIVPNSPKVLPKYVPQPMIVQQMLKQVNAQQQVPVPVIDDKTLLIIKNVDSDAANTQAIQSLQNQPDFIETLQIVNTKTGSNKQVIMGLNKPKICMQQCVDASAFINKRLGQVPPGQLTNQSTVAVSNTTQVEPVKTTPSTVPVPQVPAKKIVAVNQNMVPVSIPQFIPVSSVPSGPILMGTTSFAPIPGLFNFSQIKGLPGMKVKNIAGDNMDIKLCGSIRPPQLLKPMFPRIPVLVQRGPIPHRDIEGMVNSPKLLRYKSRFEPATVEVTDTNSSFISLQSRGRAGQKCSHTMVVIPIRDECLSFLNDTHTVRNIQTAMGQKKLADNYSERNRTENVPDNSTTLPDKDIEMTVEPENDSEIIVVDNPTLETMDHNVTDKSDSHQPEPTVSDDTITEDTIEEDMLEESKVPDAEYDWRENLHTERKNVYKQMLHQQEYDKKTRKRVLDALIGGGTKYAALKRLYRTVPQFVEDPLMGSNSSPIYYCCYLCPFASYNESKVCVHWTIKHLGQNPYICSYCPAQFPASGKAHRHMEVAHSNKKPIVKLIPSEHFSNCVEIEFLTAEERNSQALPLMRHDSESKKVKTGDNYICHQCGTLAQDEKTIKGHVQLDHLNLKPHKCNGCQKKFSSAPSADSHHCEMENERPVTYSIDHVALTLSKKLQIKDYYLKVPFNRPAKFIPEPEYWQETDGKEDDNTTHRQCRFCTFESSSFDSMWYHVRKDHNLPLGVFCNRCSAYRRLSTPERLHEFFICIRCCAMSSIKMNFDVSKKIESITLIQAYQCNKCEIKTGDIVMIKKHVMEKHTAIRPFYCNQCNKKFKMVQDGHNHEKYCNGNLIKDSILLTASIEQVNKNFLKCLYTTTNDKGTRLASLWAEHGKSVMEDIRELHNRSKKMHEAEVTGKKVKPRETANKVRPRKLGSLPPGIRRIQAEPYETFVGCNHYKCLVCQYKCIDRSCMSRHVKYMHLRIHPHSCPYCGYSNVEKTKVKLHIISIHSDTSKKVKTNVTLVAALGEESKKHFVRVTPAGVEISQLEPLNQPFAPFDGPQKIGNLDDETDISGTSDESDEESDSEYTQQIQLDLSRCGSQPLPNALLRGEDGYEHLDIQIKQEPRESDDVDSDGETALRLKRTMEDMDIDVEGLGESGGKRRRLSQKAARKMSAQIRKARKRASRERTSGRVYMDRRIENDPKLFMLPVVIMEDIVAQILSGK